MINDPSLLSSNRGKPSICSLGDHFAPCHCMSYFTEVPVDFRTMEGIYKHVSLVEYLPINEGRNIHTCKFSRIFPHN